MFACPIRPLHRFAVGVAALFGLATLVAGGRVLLGADPGYTVFRPVLVFNTLMGFAYLAAAAVIARDLGRGLLAAVAIAAVNTMGLGVVIVNRASGGIAADETLLAMTARTVVWALLAVVLAWERSRRIAA